MPKKTSIMLTTMLDPISGRQVERAVCQHPGCNKTFSQKSDAKKALFKCASRKKICL